MNRSAIAKKKQDYKMYRISSVTLLIAVVIGFIFPTYARKTYIDKIIFDGNSTFKRNVLLLNMETKESGWFSKSIYSPLKLQSDIDAIKNFYINQGFISPEVSYDLIREKNKRKLDIRITIDEGGRVKIATINICQNPVIDKKILKTIVTKPGDPMIAQQILTDALALTDSVAARGYLMGVVNPDVVIDSIALKATLTFTVKPGPRIRVGGISITGLSTVHPDVVERELRFKRGDVLTLAKVTESERNLFMSQMFNFLSINPVIGDSAHELAAVDTSVPIRISVNQARYFSIDAGLGYSAYERIFGSLMVAYSNLFARGHTISLLGSASELDQRLEAGYTYPWLFSLPFNFNVNIYYERHDNLFFDVPLPYTGNFNGFTLSIGQNRYPQLSYNIQFDWENVIRIDAPEGVPEDFPQNNTRSIRGEVMYDVRDNIINPSKGIMNETVTEIAGFGGGLNKFVKIENAFRAYFTMFDSVLYLSSSITAGWAAPYGSSEVLPIQDRFYAGGPRSVRGYRLDELITTENGEPRGGNVELILNIIDIQFPLFWIIKGAVFSDAGYIWDSLQDVDLRDIKFTAGPGLRVVSPIGILRFDVGFKLDRLGERDSYRMYFDIGRPF